MKKQIGFSSIILLGVVALSFTSCSKQMDGNAQNNERDIANLSSPPSCATANPTFIGLQILNGNGNKFFWYGNKSVVANRQTFSESDLSDKKFMEITAEIDPDRPQTGNFQVLNPVAPIHFGGRQRIGVKSTTPTTKFTDLGDAIRPGEALVFKLGTNVATKKMWKARINIEGSGVADVEFWDGNTKRGEVAVTLTSNAAQIAEFSTSPDNAFNTIKFKCKSGNYGVKGFVESQFFLIESSNAYVGMHFQNGAGQKYIFRNNIPNARNPANRQQQVQEGGEFVNYNANTPNGQKFINATATGPIPRFSYFGGQHRLGVGDRYLDAGESMIFEVGPDFGSSKMSLVSIIPNAPGQIRAQTFDGATLVGTFTSNGLDGSPFLVGNTNNFTRVVLTRVTGRPALGRNPTTSVRFYMACTP